MAKVAPRPTGRKGKDVDRSSIKKGKDADRVSVKKEKDAARKEKESAKQEKDDEEEEESDDEGGTATHANSNGRICYQVLVSEDSADLAAIKQRQDAKAFLKIVLGRVPQLDAVFRATAEELGIDEDKLFNIYVDHRAGNKHWFEIQHLYTDYWTRNIEAECRKYLDPDEFGFITVSDDPDTYGVCFASFKKKYKANMQLAKDILLEDRDVGILLDQPITYGKIYMPYLDEDDKDDEDAPSQNDPESPSARPSTSISAYGRTPTRARPGTIRQMPSDSSRETLQEFIRLQLATIFDVIPGHKPPKGNYSYWLKLYPYLVQFGLVLINWPSGVEFPMFNVTTRGIYGMSVNELKTLANAFTSSQYPIKLVNKEAVMAIAGENIPAKSYLAIVGYLPIQAGVGSVTNRAWYLKIGNKERANFDIGEVMLLPDTNAGKAASKAISTAGSVSTRSMRNTKSKPRQPTIELESDSGAEVEDARSSNVKDYEDEHDELEPETPPPQRPLRSRKTAIGALLSPLPDSPQQERQGSEVVHRRHEVFEINEVPSPPPLETRKRKMEVAVEIPSSKRTKLSKAAKAAKAVKAAEAAKTTKTTKPSDHNANVPSDLDDETAPCVMDDPMIGHSGSEDDRIPDPAASTVGPSVSEHVAGASSAPGDCVRAPSTMDDVTPASALGSGNLTRVPSAAGETAVSSATGEVIVSPSATGEVIVSPSTTGDAIVSSSATGDIVVSSSASGNVNGPSTSGDPADPVTLGHAVAPASASGTSSATPVTTTDAPAVPAAPSAAAQAGAPGQADDVNALLIKLLVGLGSKLDALASR
ncbi:hypothetical protein CERSUDRAFT_78573 [Gelatoporia subvermispora B]|uniref:Uncharacterized protein n=1 Tax=Ceriporiopsis subvermispora (strain B) TaxID=914234 RepID=M2QY25_CERS8|nr:hypothetical protein CERSUDRAFT_78573 [Gelatoporia subvermispora B]